MNTKVIVIGSGFSSLSAACYLSKNGYDVTIYEKNNTIGQIFLILFLPILVKKLLIITR